MIYGVSDQETPRPPAAVASARTSDRAVKPAFPMVVGSADVARSANCHLRHSSAAYNLITSAARSKASSAPTSAAPSLSGPAYSQALADGRDFESADLSGVLLAHLDLRGKDFQRANAAGAVFVGSLLNGANFAHANLRGADLRDTCLRGAIFTAAELAGADFTGADVTGATVTVHRDISGNWMGIAATPGLPATVITAFHGARSLPFPVNRLRNSPVRTVEPGQSYQCRQAIPQGVTSLSGRAALGNTHSDRAAAHAPWKSVCRAPPRSSPSRWPSWCLPRRQDRGFRRLDRRGRRPRRPVVLPEPAPEKALVNERRPLPFGSIRERHDCP